MGLCCVITGSCIIFLHWRKKLQQERCAQQWVEVMTAATFTYDPLLYWINTQRHHGINAAIKIGHFPAFTNTEIKVQIPECLWDSDTPEGKGYGLRGSSPKAESPIAMKAALVVTHQPDATAPDNLKSANTKLSVM
ncbi:Testis-expressed sequence 38 protein [Sciurus carolinensis]|uniref:Testis-expressed sequence 38 protein n=1 Tax=Sciurus carolinensis TaxID=30640 RepID=A0AA41NIH9_SCICA|nr:Testis-expressed sequence 38 protein [Sciurus carolinensis]